MRSFSRAALVMGAISALVGCGGDDEPIVSCPAETATLCDDACADLATDRSHCGACNAACASGQACVDGACIGFCPAGQVADAGGGCVNLDSDPLNCGAVGTACATGELCAAGACSQTCETPLAACGSSCADLTSDTSHCGACDAACAPGLACHRGACVSPCDGLPTTDGRPLDTLHMIVPVGNEARVQWSYIIAEALREIGIVGVVRRVSFSYLLDAFDFSRREPGTAGYDLAFVGFTIQDPRPVVSSLSCMTFTNYSGWCNTDYEDARRVYDTSLDQVMRIDAVRRMQETFVEELPKFMLLFEDTVYGVPRDIGNFDAQLGNTQAHLWTGPSNVLVALPVAPDHLNPLFVESIYEFAITDLVFEPLFMPDGVPDTPTYGQPVAVLASTVPAMVPTGVGTEHTVTIDVRPSTFTDGHAVDAYDVAFTYQLFLHPSFDGARSEALRTLGLDHTSVEVVDSNTIRFRFPAPAPDFAYDMALSIMPMHHWLPHTTSAEALSAYEANIDATGYVGPLPVPDDSFDDGSETFGSGPYMPDTGGRWSAATGTARFVRHAGSGTPVADVSAVTIRVSSREDVLTELAAGASLLISENFAFQPEELEGFPGIRVIEHTSLNFQEMGANLSNSFLADQQVRRAIDLALPRQAIIDITRAGLGVPAHSYVSPTNSFAHPDFEEGGPFGPVYDVAAARTTLRSAGHTSLESDAPTLQSDQALLCNTEEALAGWVAAGEIDEATADVILSDLARAMLGIY